MSIPPFFAHQLVTVDKASGCPGFMDFSDPGTAKSRAHLKGFEDTGGGKLLVVAPKSILQPSWGNDIDRFFPGMSYVVANASNRAKAFEQDVDVVLTNHDAAAWLLKNKKVLKGFSHCITDESTAYKNPQAARSKAMKALMPLFKWRRTLSGTPVPNSILEIWHQALLVDDGDRLGNSYWKFRNAVCEPYQTGPRPEMIEWRDKPGVEQAVFDLLSDISIRHKRENCISMPPNTVSRIYVDLSKKARDAYDAMLDDSIATINGVDVSAVHAAAKMTKMLQITSGAVYNGDSYQVIDDARTELIMDLVEARPHSLVAFNWKHQRDALVEAAKKRGFSFAVLDGEAKDIDRIRAVEEFQAGKLKLIFAHPRSAAHGLTLVRGTTTIWSSPTFSSEAYEQFNARIYRAGQTQHTETIQICATNTVEERVYSVLEKKITAMQAFLGLMEAA